MAAIPFDQAIYGSHDQARGEANRSADREERARAERDDDLRPCAGRNPPFLAVKHPARPYKSAIENRCTAEMRRPLK